MVIALPSSSCASPTWPDPVPHERKNSVTSDYIVMFASMLIVQFQG